MFLLLLTICCSQPLTRLDCDVHPTSLVWPVSQECFALFSFLELVRVCACACVRVCVCMCVCRCRKQNQRTAVEAPIAGREPRNRVSWELHPLDSTGSLGQQPLGVDSKEQMTTLSPTVPGFIGHVGPSWHRKGSLLHGRWARSPHCYLQVAVDSLGSALVDSQITL